MKNRRNRIARVLFFSILTVCMLTACQRNPGKRQHKKGEYVTLIRYDGKNYHYNQGCTLLEPEKEVGVIESLTEYEGDLPEKNWQVNSKDENWLGTNIYVNSDEEFIYIYEGQTLENGKKVYECYAQGDLKQRDLADGIRPAYVTYHGTVWRLKENKRQIPTEYKIESDIHSWGECYIEKDCTTNVDELLGGKIYASEKNADMLYVETLDGRIWEAKLAED